MFKYGLHCFALFMELSVLLGLSLLPLCVDFDSKELLVHERSMEILVPLSCGLSMSFMAMAYYLGSLRMCIGSSPSRKVFGGAIVLFLIGAVMIVFGCVRLAAEHPEWNTLEPIPRTAEQRAEAFSAVKITFDAAGGVCDGKVRICKVGQNYSSNMNLFPSEDHRYIIGRYRARFNLPTGCFSIQSENLTGGVAIDGYYTTNAVPLVGSKEKWMYVIDVLEFDGSIKDWLVGQTWTTNFNSYTQFNLGRIDGNIQTGQYFIPLTATDYGQFNYLERAVIRTDAGQKFVIRFRVSLFAGTSVNKSNYHYVKPGETIDCSLPAPTRDGYEFDGWYDGDNRVTESTKVERREDHTLTARWRKQ